MLLNDQRPQETLQVCIIVRSVCTTFKAKASGFAANLTPCLFRYLENSSVAAGVIESIMAIIKVSNNRSFINSFNVILSCTVFSI